MKLLIITAAILAVTSGLTIKAKQNPEPRIVAQHDGRDCCDSRDGLLPPCISTVLSIESNMPTPISVELFCGTEVINPVVDLPRGKIRQEVEICPETPGHITCSIMNWKKKE